jgi:hypothetical protein
VVKKTEVFAPLVFLTETVKFTILVMEYFELPILIRFLQKFQILPLNYDHKMLSTFSLSEAPTMGIILVYYHRSLFRHLSSYL